MNVIDSWLSISLLLCICWLLSQLCGGLLMGLNDDVMPVGCSGCPYAGTDSCDDTCNWYWLDD